MEPNIGQLDMHPDHGYNMTIPVCFWCGTAKTEVACLGKHYPGEAPPFLVVNYAPCPACIRGMREGVTIIEVIDTKPEDNRPAIQDDPDVWPTGRWVTVTIPVAKGYFAPEVFDSILANRLAYLYQVAFESSGLGRLYEQANEPAAG